MKMFFESENNTNGALVIPKWMCIKFDAEKIDNTNFKNKKTSPKAGFLHVH